MSVNIRGGEFFLNLMVCVTVDLSLQDKSHQEVKNSKLAINETCNYWYIVRKMWQTNFMRLMPIEHFWTYKKLYVKSTEKYDRCAGKMENISALQ